MYCPQCGTEAQATQYCRTCGANLKVIGKAVALSEAVARSDRGPLPKIKEMIKEFKVDHVSDEVSGALDRLNQNDASMAARGSHLEGRKRRQRNARITSRKVWSPCFQALDSRCSSTIFQ